MAKHAWHRLLRVGSAILFTMIVLALLLELAAVYAYRTEGDTPLPSNFGNFGHVRAMLKPEAAGETFSFAVLGDSREHSALERICDVLRGEPLALMIHLGDFTARPTEENHRFLRAELPGEVSSRFPMFYIPGNHDVDEETYPLSQFEETYGPTNFSFEYKDCLFIVVRVLDERYDTAESLSFLERALAEKRDRFRRVFVFSHIPPPVSDMFSARSFQNAWEFVRLYDQYKVDYVIAGDYHGYVHVKRHNTDYFVTGGAGSRLKERTYGRFHHALVFQVGPDTISLGILHVEGTGRDLEDEWERLAIIKLPAFYRDHPMTCILANALVVTVLGGLVVLWWRGRRRRHALRRAEASGVDAQPRRESAESRSGVEQREGTNDRL